MVNGDVSLLIGQPASLHLISFTASLVLSKLLEARRRIGLKQSLAREGVNYLIFKVPTRRKEAMFKEVLIK